MAGRRRRALKWVLPVVAAILAACVVVILIVTRPSRTEPPRPYSPPRSPFGGSSDELEETVIVPTLDTPMPEGKNVIWCASFQLAWNQMRDAYVGEPIRIANAEELAERLNNAAASKDDLEPESYYVKAGAVAEGVIEQIQQDMAARFPDAPTPEIDASIEAVVAYAYLAANVKFTIPYFENDEKFLFNGTRVSSFGVREKDDYAYRDLRRQVAILYNGWNEDDDPPFGWEFAVDPCKTSDPYQLILACIRPEGTLDATLAKLDERIADWDAHEYDRELGLNNVLLVPNVYWRIFHHFREMEGTDKRILNEGSPIYMYWVSEASQLIDFKLDRSGAELKSEARHIVKAAGSINLIFDRPFLIVMRKRGAEQPFFVMSVANAELLCKR